MKISNKEKQELISKLRGSVTFKKASTSSALLQYLHEATLKGTDLTETVVNIEFFGSKELHEKTNPKVRVNISNLRKKIEQYYTTEGSDDIWQVHIDKGQYQLRFTRKATRLDYLLHYKWTKALPYVALAISLTMLLFTNLPTGTPQLWKSLIQKNETTNLYVGDVFGMSGTTTIGTRGWTRALSINSHADYNNLLQDQPWIKEKLQPSSYTYATSMAVLSTQRLQEFFQERNGTFNIRFSTKSTTTEIKESNAIYVGNIGNNNRFINFFNEANSHCKLTRSTVSIKNHPILKDTFYIMNAPGDYEEYAVVSKYPAPNNTEHFVFFSRHDMGITASVEYFTNIDSIKSFTENQLGEYKYFTAIFKVKGRDRTSTNIKLEEVMPF